MAKTRPWFGAKVPHRLSAGQDTEETWLCSSDHCLPTSSLFEEVGYLTNEGQQAAREQPLHKPRFCKFVGIRHVS